MPQATVNITPTPRILTVLAHTTMEPIDALCELIDNAIDSFQSAQQQGIAIDNPTVRIDVPTVRQINRREGYLRVSDNGPGMTLDQVQKALCAGYSSNNAFDQLGLFGVGFNISTSKFGIRTRVATMRPGNAHYLRVTLDLQEINRNKCFDVPYEEVPQTGIDEFFPRTNMSGTVIEVSHWWPDGDTNHAFTLDLAKISDAQLRRTLGRRYSTLLCQRKVRLLVNGKECEPFHHCVWCADRFVTRHGVNIPAVMSINEVVGTVRKCENCGAEVGDARECPECHSLEIREVVQRVTGWVGIQRYEDRAKYGIDLIRNGRCICEAEKTAFFYFKNEDGILEKEYPQDNGGTNGRIIGEIHMDFVPVGFTKEDFDRTSIEWHKAIKCLRGETSLLPSRVPEGATPNNSPIYRLFQAYRRSDPGITWLYMGVYDITKHGPTRISKDVIEDYKQRFERNEEGYGWDDDREWYKHVESCMNPPVPESPRCPNCQADLVEGMEVCPVCGMIIIGKNCVSCGVEIPRSARQCPHCGADQNWQPGGGPGGGSTDHPPSTDNVFWICQVCHARNVVTDTVCQVCHHERGTLDPLGEEYLLANSDKKDELSCSDFALELPCGDRIPKYAFEVYFTRTKIVPYASDGHQLAPLPFVEIRSTNRMKLFVDPMHMLFRGGDVAVKEVIAEEVAQHIFDYSLSQQQQNELSSRLAILVDIVKRSCWENDFNFDQHELTERIGQVFKAIKEQLVENATEEDDYFSCLEEKTETLHALTESGVAVERFQTICTSGEFIRYAPDSFVLQLFKDYPKDFFDKGVFKSTETDESIQLFGAEAVQMQYDLNVRQIQGHLQTLLTFASMKQVRNPDSDYITLVRLSMIALIKKMAIHV